MVFISGVNHWKVAECRAGEIDQTFIMLPIIVYCKLSHAILLFCCNLKVKFKMATIMVCIFLPLSSWVIGDSRLCRLSNSALSHVLVIWTLCNLLLNCFVFRCLTFSHRSGFYWCNINWPPYYKVLVYIKKFITRLLHMCATVYGVLWSAEFDYIFMFKWKQPQCFLFFLSCRQVCLNVA